MSDEDDDPLAPGVGTGEPPPVVRVRPLTPPRRIRSRARYRLRRAIALFALVVIGFGAWFAWSLWQPFASGGSGTVVVTIPPHTGTRAIGDLLAGRASSTRASSSSSAPCSTATARSCCRAPTTCATG